MIVVTGGNGFLGSHIVNKLKERDLPVRVLVRDLNQAKIEGRLNGLDIEYIEGDVTKPDTLLPAFRNASAVIHTVAIAVEKKHLTYEAVNTTGTKNVIDQLEASGPPRLINISQLGAKPDLPYRFLASKGKAEKLVSKSKLEWTTFKPSVIWGPEDEFANTFARLAKITPLIFPIISKDAQFQPIWVNDVADAVVKSLDEKKTIRNTFELGGPEVLTLYEIERRTLEATGVNRIFIPFPMPILKIVVRIMENILPSLPVTSSLLELLAVDNVTSSNDTYQFTSQPRHFMPENTAKYMKEFSITSTINQYLGRN